jgi:hypothetical protein
LFSSLTTFFIYPIIYHEKNNVKLFKESGKMKKTIVWLAVVFFVAQFAACVHTNTTVLDAANIREPIDPADVIIYTTARKVPGEYEEIALLNSKADSASTSEAQMFKSMRKKAAKLGANAIILDAVSEPTVGAKIAAAVLFGTGAERKGKALAIYVIPGSKKTRRQSMPLESEDYIDKYVKIKAQNYSFQGGNFTDVVIRGVVFDYRNKAFTLLVLHSGSAGKESNKKAQVGPGRFDRDHQGRAG